MNETRISPAWHIIRIDWCRFVDVSIWFWYNFVRDYQFFGSSRILHDAIWSTRVVSNACDLPIVDCISSSSVFRWALFYRLNHAYITRMTVGWRQRRRAFEIRSAIICHLHCKVFTAYIWIFPIRSASASHYENWRMKKKNARVAVAVPTLNQISHKDNVNR